MSDMVERVAKAIVEERFMGAITWEGVNEIFKKMYLDQARAAIKSLYQPNDYMLIRLSHTNARC